jgi:hypothetical protein
MSNAKGGAMFKLVALLAAAGLLAVAAGAGQARAGGGPYTCMGRTCTGQLPPFEDHVAAIQPESSLCGFDIRLDQAGSGYFTAVFDGLAVNGMPTGNFVRGSVHLDITGTVAANGKMLEVQTHETVLFTSEPGRKEVGLAFKMFLPSVGVVLWGRGRLVFDANGNIVFDAGSHPEPEGDITRMQGLCTALAA